MEEWFAEQPSSTQTKRSSAFKKGLKRMHGCAGEEGQSRCMLLNMMLPSELVIAAHLFPRKNEAHVQQALGFEGIDNLKNGLLLFGPLEKALDKRQVSIIYDRNSKEFHLKLFDHHLLQQRLFDHLTESQQWVLVDGAQGYDIETTFRAIDGRKLHFGTDKRPFKRCLNLQARLARKKAIREGWDFGGGLTLKTSGRRVP
ncbi:hypothetical protein PHYSODRAFT_297806 [Phytophthora sojae]|uniref:HNH nuclease domain-containing protein n=1 Tax=Phytophthora sojae (strain P6497) TaxID=1094619 RepID=G4Z9N8_PHYSP|nr:hypothetical protein PHYSODRAFT_297806 [Phytophthora sojae]EGZ19152.1 hypothetical protein PHYSODRAFT_297806 [Phytophthora sojae]|eukprot:XP_009521869.1 hypothetical protein PHYSODRAFT_297806 [Phytophthora sojae]